MAKGKMTKGKMGKGEMANIGGEMAKGEMGINRISVPLCSVSSVCRGTLVTMSKIHIITGVSTNFFTYLCFLKILYICLTHGYRDPKV
jgi:hypothetical protein